MASALDALYIKELRMRVAEKLHQTAYWVPSHLTALSELAERIASGSLALGKDELLVFIRG